MDSFIPTNRILTIVNDGNNCVDEDIKLKSYEEFMDNESFV